MSSPDDRLDPSALDPDLPADVPVPGADSLLLAVIAVGGVIGAEGRYGIGLLLPHGSTSFDWGTLIINVLGGLAIGVLMAVLGRLAHPHRLIRPFLGVGILGGFTTFSTFSTDTYRLLDAGRPAVALVYAALTLTGALAATVAGARLVATVLGPAEAA